MARPGEGNVGDIRDEEITRLTAEVERLNKDIAYCYEERWRVEALIEARFEKARKLCIQQQGQVNGLREALRKIHNDAEELDLKQLLEITHTALSSPALTPSGQGEKHGKCACSDKEIPCPKCWPRLVNRLHALELVAEKARGVMDNDNGIADALAKLDGEGKDRLEKEGKESR